MAEASRAHDEAILAALIRLMAHWSSPPVQARIAADAGIDLDPTAIRALYVLGRNGGALRPAELADILAQSRPTTSKLLARLTPAGLVRRGKEESDGRGAVIDLTDFGRASYARLVGAGVDMVASATDGWDPDSSATFTARLERFVATLIGEPEPSTIRVETRGGIAAAPSTVGAASADRENGSAL